MNEQTALGGRVLAALPPLLYVYMPRPPVPGSHLLVYPVLAGSLVALGSLIATRRSTLDRRLLVVAAICLLLSVIAGIAGMVNSDHIRATAPLDLVRPAVLLTFFTYGYYLVRYRGEEEVRNGLLFAAFVILIGQAAVGTLQLSGVSFDLIYAEDRFRPLGGALRITGSLANPNFLAWIVAQASIIILLLSSSRLRYLALLLSAPLVLLSGSRTVLLLFPAMVAAASVLHSPGRFRITGAALGYGLVMGLAFFVAIVRFGDHFRYLAQLRDAIASGSLTSVRSFAVRVDGWKETFAVFEANGVSAWLIGLGSREITRVLDNDFLYVLFRFGAIGFVIHIALLVYLFWLLWSARTSAISRLGLHYLCFALLMGALLETLGGWMHPLLLFYFAGMATATARQGMVSTSAASAAVATRFRASARGTQTLVPTGNPRQPHRFEARRELS